MPDFEESYLGQLRKLVGDRKIIVTAARVVIRDEQGRVLFIRRRDNGLWAMPGGAQELDESILECVKRETNEECGLQVRSAVPMAIYSNISARSVYGDPFHLFIVQFLVDDWDGELLTETDETTEARFFDPEDPPEALVSIYQEVLDDLRKYDGGLILK